jgi:ribosomal-protein-alanine N-acetyltransferase
VASLQTRNTAAQCGLRPTRFAFAICHHFPRQEGILGYCGFLHHAELPGEVEIGYRLDPACWNRGLIIKAARAVRDYAFADLKLPRVISLIHPDNIPSRRVAEKIVLRSEKEITFRGFATIVFALSQEQREAANAAG